ncbi:MAG: hypothetical protein AcusKO_34200 [Acuticoccus sp.]
MHRDDQRPVRLNGRSVSSADVFDELEQFVDSEPVGWTERQPRPRGSTPHEEGAADAGDASEPARRRDEPAGDVAFSRAGAHRRTDQLDAPISQAAGETSVSRRREAFAQRLSAELDRSAEPPAERPAPEVAREKVAPRFDRPVTTPTRPAAEAAPARPAPPRPGPDIAPARPHARAMPPAPSLTPKPPAAPIPPTPPAPAIGGAEEPPAPELEFDDDDGPADALDWELDNAIGAIVASTHKKADEPDEAPAAPVAPSAAPQTDVTGVDAPQPQRQPEPAAPMDPPPTVVGTRRPRPVPTFRFERRTEADEAETAAPPDFDNPLTSILFKDVRAKFDAVHPQPDDDYDAGEDEFADYGAGDELEDEYAFDDADADLPASLRRSGTRRKSRMSGRAVGLVVVGAVGLAVLVVGGLIGLNVFAGGGVSGREPPVIHADARDVKVRATNITVDAEPDIMERTALGDTEELVLPDRVVIDRAQPPAVFEGDEDVLAEPRARRVVLRRDGTIVPSGATETRSVGASGARPAASAPPVTPTPPAATGTAAGTASLGAGPQCRRARRRQRARRRSRHRSSVGGRAGRPRGARRCRTAGRERHRHLAGHRARCHCRGHGDGCGNPRQRHAAAAARAAAAHAPRRDRSHRPAGDRHRHRHRHRRHGIGRRPLGRAGLLAAHRGGCAAVLRQLPCPLRQHRRRPAAGHRGGQCGRSRALLSGAPARRYARRGGHALPAPEVGRGRLLHRAKLTG